MDVIDGNTSKEFRKLEESIINKVQKVFIKEMDKQCKSIYVLRILFFVALLYSLLNSTFLHLSKHKN